MPRSPRRSSLLNSSASGELEPPPTPGPGATFVSSASGVTRTPAKEGRPIPKAKASTKVFQQKEGGRRGGPRPTGPRRSAKGGETLPQCVSRSVSPLPEPPRRTSRSFARHRIAFSGHLESPSLGGVATGKAFKEPLLMIHLPWFSGRVNGRRGRTVSTCVLITAVWT